MKRCSWVENKEQIYLDYHDNEWGKAVYDDQILYEFFLLEAFQAGLAWITVLKKRSAFKIAFDNFDYVKISQYDQIKIDELMNNPQIIRSNLKIKAAINNAKIFIAIQNEFKTFSNYLWSFTDNKVIKRTSDSRVTTSYISDAISADLKKRGAKFMGSVTVYSYLEAIGILDNHDLECDCY